MAVARLLSLALILTALPARAQVEPAATPAARSPDGGLGKFSPTPVAPQAPAGTPVERLKWLTDQLDLAVKDAADAGARVGIAVTEVDTGKLIYGKNEGLPFNAASNVKLFTTAAALALLGPEYRWKTVVYSDGLISGGELKGKLYLKGHGDPTLVIEDLWRIVADLSAAGLHKVSGELVVDDTWFDDVRVGPAFDQKLEDLPFRAPNGALSLNYNAVGVHVLPGAGDGAPARVAIDPQTPYFTILNEARTVAGARTALVVESADAEGHTEIRVRGRIKLGDSGVLQLRRVAHPDLYTAYAFRDLLVKRGIKTGNITRGAVPEGAHVLAAHYSQPLGVAVRDVNKRSNNFMAEQVLKTVGAETVGPPGTWAKGLDAIGAFLERVGIMKKDYKMLNGSGLYDSNRFTPAQLVTLLRAAYRDFRFSADFVGSLALAGADGTISHRMEGGLAERYVRAKTGTLQGISCLSGYAGAPLKAPLAFSVLMNGLTDQTAARGRRAQDQIAKLFVTYLMTR